MISRPRDFGRLQSAGTARSHPLLMARSVRTDLDVTRFGLATSRKLGGAVVRNRIRRQLKEALRALGPEIRPGWDVLIVARAGLVGADPAAREAALRRVLGQGILAEAGKGGARE